MTRDWPSVVQVVLQLDDRLGRAPAGWKIGAASEEIRRAEGLPGPSPGRIYLDTVFTEPGRPSRSALHQLPQRRVRVRVPPGRRDSPCASEPYTEEEVAAHIECLMPTLEIGDMVFEDWYGASGYFGSCLDNGGGAALVCGPRSSTGASSTCRTRGSRSRSTGTFVKEGFGRAAMGHPLTSLTWLVNWAISNGRRIADGEIISTGTCTGHCFVAPGDEVALEVGGLGVVEALFEDVDRVGDLDAHGPDPGRRRASRTPPAGGARVRRVPRGVSPTAARRKATRSRPSSTSCSRTRATGGSRATRSAAPPRPCRPTSNIPRPAGGGVFDSTVQHVDGSFRHADFVRPGVECELAVRLIRDLEARDAPFERSEITAAVGSVMAAIEVVDDRYSDWGSLGAHRIDRRRFLRRRLRSRPRARRCGRSSISPPSRHGMTVNGVEVGAGVGADILGDPLTALMWLVNEMAGYGHSFRRGSFVLLGSLVQNADAGRASMTSWWSRTSRSGG